MRVSSEVVIHAPAATVFDYVADVELDVEWQEAAVWTRLREPGPVRLGSLVDHEGRFMGMRLRTSGSITVFEPGRRFGYDFRSAFGSSAMRYELEPIGSTTKVRLSVASPLPFPLRPLSRLMARNVQGMFDRDVARLRDRIEARAASPA